MLLYIHLLKVRVVFAFVAVLMIISGLAVFSTLGIMILKITGRWHPAQVLPGIIQSLH